MISGVAIGSAQGNRESRSERQAPAPTEVDADVDVDVLHNPPVLFEKGTPITLEFALVCPIEVCPTRSAELAILDHEGAALTVTADPDADGHFVFVVPESVAASGSFNYTVTFGMEGQPSVEWPSSGTAMQAFAIDDALPVDLGEAPFSGPALSKGQQVLAARWGTAPSELGHAGTSFDVTPDGAVVVLDTWNSRLSWFMNGKLTAQRSVDLPPDYPDLAVEDGGAVDVLLPGGGTGRAKVLRYTDGQAPITVAMKSGRASQIRARGDGVQVLTQSSNWVTVVSAGKPLASEEQASHTAVASVDGQTRTYVKHVDGNKVLIGKASADGQCVTWQISAESWLGPVKLAESTDWGVILVQSIYSDTDSVNAVVQLFNDGRHAVTWVPNQQYAEMTANSDFRWSDDHLYAARSTRDGFAVVRYDVRPTAPGTSSPSPRFAAMN